jgi:hypothetical protein
MSTQSQTKLMAEVRRYLAAVEAFRAEGHEPQWLPEREPAKPVVPRRRPVVLGAPPIP